METDPSDNTAACFACSIVSQYQKQLLPSLTETQTHGKIGASFKNNTDITL